jgi:hypothetical protein
VFEDSNVLGLGKTIEAKWALADPIPLKPMTEGFYEEVFTFQPNWFNFCVFCRVFFSCYTQWGEKKRGVSIFKSQMLALQCR